MRRIKIPLAAMVVLTSCIHRLPPDKPIFKPINYAGKEWIFPTGSRVINYQDPNATEFMLDVSYAVGGRDEVPGKEGLAHLCEHMAFKGRADGAKSPQIWERLLAGGVQFNAFTSNDNTDYWETGRPSQLNGMIILEAQRMRDPLANVTEADFESERDVVIAEYRQRLESDPQGAMFTQMLKDVFGSSIYAREVAGASPEELHNLTLDDVRAWYHDHYVPNNATIVITGPKPINTDLTVVATAFRELAEGTKGMAAVQPLPRKAPEMPADPAPNTFLTHRLALEQPELLMGWTVPGFYSGLEPKAFATTAALNLLLNQRFGDDDRVDEIGAFPILFDGVGVIAVDIKLHDEADAQKVSEVVQDQLVALSTTHGLTTSDNVSAGMLNEVTDFTRGQLLTQSYLNMEQLFAPPIAQYVRAHPDHPDYVGGWQNEIRDDLEFGLGDFPVKYVSRQRAVSVLFAPLKGEAARVSAGSGFARAPESFGDKLDPLPPGKHDIVAVAGHAGLDKVDVQTLPNGLKVIVAKRGGMPLVDVRMIIKIPPPGANGQNPALPRIAAMAGWESEQEDFHVEKIGGTVLNDVGRDFLAFGAEVPSGNLQHLLADCETWEEGTTIDGQVFKRSMRREASLMTAKEKRAQDRARDILRNKLFPGHPYGIVATAADAEKVTVDDASAWLKKYLRPDRATLLIVGDVDDGPELWDQIKSRLGGWTASGPAPADTVVDAPLPSARTITVVDRPGATQSEILIGLRQPIGDQSADASMSSLQWYLGKELMTTLREKQGVTYGVNPFQVKGRLGWMFGLDTAVDQRATATSVQTILTGLQVVEEKGMTPELIERANWQTARMYPLKFDTVGKAAEALEDLVTLDRHVDFWESYPEALAALQPEQIRNSANNLGIGKESIVIVGDEASVVPQLKAAGFQVEVVAAPASDDDKPKKDKPKT